VEPVVLARIGVGELSAIIGGLAFVAIMAFLLLGGKPDAQPVDPKSPASGPGAGKRKGGP